MQTKKVKTLTALAAAVAIVPMTPAFAEVDLYKSNDGGAIPGPGDDPTNEPSVDMNVSEDVRVYLHTAIEVEQMIYREDPDDGDTNDSFDNEIEFGVGAEFDKNWEAYFELEFDNLSDTNSNTHIRNGRGGDLEITNAWVNWADNDQFQARVGVFRPNLFGDTRIWFREHMVGARLNYGFNNGLETEAGTGILTEEGHAYGEDRQITWLSARLGGFYATQGLFQDEPRELTAEEFVVDPAEGSFGDLYNLALGWQGTLGGIVDTQLEFNQNFGEAENGQEYRGQAAYAEFSVEAGMHEPHLLFAWGSGDDDPNDGDADEFYEARADLKLTKILIDEGYVENVAYPNVGGVEEGKDSIGNVTLAQIGDTFQVTSVWKAAATASYVSLTEDNANGDTYLGTEINLLNQWNLPTSRDVRLYLDLAYVFSGDALGPDDVWLIEPGIRVTF